MCLALAFHVCRGMCQQLVDAQVQLRILAPLLDWKRWSSFQSSPFSIIRIIPTKCFAGLIELFLFATCSVAISFLLTQMQLCFFLGRLINFECCRVCPWIALQSSRREIHCTSCQQCREHLRLSSECQASKELVGDLLGGALHHHCSLKALDIEVFIMMRAATTLFVFCVSLSFCKNVGFLVISFSMIEITYWSVSMTSAISASNLLIFFRFFGFHGL